MARLRAAKGASAAEVARAVGVSTKTLYRYESEECPKSPRLCTVTKLADYFGVTAGYLLCLGEAA